MNKPKRFFKSVKPQTLALPTKAYKFPSISLTFPEGWSRKAILSPVFLTAFTSGFLVMAIGIVGADIHTNIARLDVIRHERSVVDAKIAEWKSIVSRFKGYRDGYYQLAVFEYQLGYYEKSYEYLKKVLAIDPDYGDALQLMEKLAVN